MLPEKPTSFTTFSTRQNEVNEVDVEGGCFATVVILSEK